MKLLAEGVPEHHHCRECGDVVSRFVNYCGPCDRRLKEAAKRKELMDLAEENGRVFTEG